MDAYFANFYYIYDSKLTKPVICINSIFLSSVSLSMKKEGWSELCQKGLKFRFFLLLLLLLSRFSLFIIIIEFVKNEEKYINQFLNLIQSFFRLIIYKYEYKRYYEKNEVKKWNDKYTKDAKINKLISK